MYGVETQSAVRTPSSTTTREESLLVSSTVRALCPLTLELVCLSLVRNTHCFLL